MDRRTGGEFGEWYVEAFAMLDDKGSIHNAQFKVRFLSEISSQISIFEIEEEPAKWKTENLNLPPPHHPQIAPWSSR